MYLCGGFFKKMFGSNEILNASMPIGNGHEVVDISATDHTVVSSSVRAIDVLVGGDVKIDYLDYLGDTKTRTTYVLAGHYKFATNITKVYKVGTAATSITLVW